MPQLSFISANYVARALNYNGVEDWMAHDAATIQSTNAETFAAVARDVKNAGFNAIDIWTGHANYAQHDAQHFADVKRICAEHGLQITSYAGGFSVQKLEDFDAPFSAMKALGAPIFAGGISGLPDAELAPLVQAACEKHDVRWGFENHPQKTTAEILSKIGNGECSHCGVALDTGWCGTQGLDALEAAKAVRDHLFILHLKDVEAVGAHDTCAVGEGVVPCEAVVKYLLDSGWNGTICIEHEPYNRDPMPEILRSVERVQSWIG
jgi:L-ribulose-5-phosphate 3-epimerase